MSESATAANDAAISVALFHYAMKHKRDYKNLTVMGLSGASHGDSLSCMSVSDEYFSKGLPTYEWPKAPLPVMIQPFNQNKKANDEEEARCLAEAAKIIEQQRASGKDVGAIIVEPISGLANNQATPTYYKKLR